MEPIKFNIGDESRIIVEKRGFKASLFADQYQEAFTLINSFLSREKGSRASNVITICGDRGEGKSSFLYSVHNILGTPEVFAAANDVFPVNSQFGLSKILPIRIIDPSYFDSEHNLIELLLGLMFAGLREYDIEQSDYSQRISEKTAILKLFQKVKKSFSVLKPQKNRASAYDQLEDLDELAAAVTVRQELEELFSAYAKFFGKEKLMVCVDDLDLNIEGGYRMAEDIRKYLSQSDHCVVLVALKVDQLTDVVKTYLRNKLNDRLVSDIEVEEMAARYVTKFLPLGQRIWMPKGTEIIEKNIEISDGNLQYKWETVKEAVVRLIYKKTRYIFVNGAGVSPVVPTNLRNLRHLIGMLWNLPDAKKDNNQDVVENKQIFKHYFYQTWTKCLGKEESAFVQELLNIENVQDINRFVISYYSKYIKENDKENDAQTNDLLMDILDTQNVNYNISLGDVYFVLNHVNQTTTDTNTKNVLFFTRAYYSMCLYDRYNSISIDEQHLYPTAPENEPSIYKYNLIFKETNLLQRFVNGSYFTYPVSWILASKDRNKSISRDRRLINATALWEDVARIADQFAMYNDMSNDEKKLFLARLHRCEFFALTTVGSYIGKNQTKFRIDRQLSSPVYLLPFAKTRSYLAFDVLSIFYNILNVRMAYNRIEVINGVKLYDIADQIQESLLNQMREKCCKLDDKSRDSKLTQKDHGLISDATLRFSEVQMAILDTLRNNRLLDKHRDKGDNTYKLRCLYKDIQDMKIALYPLEEGENPYVLPFHFLDPIIEMLLKENEADFNRVFILTAKQNIDSVEELGNEVYEKISNLFKRAITSSLKYPKTGKQLRERILRVENELYKKCGGSDFWEEIFPKDVTFYNLSEVYYAIAKYYDAIRDALGED